MLSTRSTRQIRNMREEEALESDNFAQNVNEVVDLLKQGKLSQEEADLLLKIILTLHVEGQANQMKFYVEDTLTDVFHELLTDVNAARR